jgi:hypothetical protein
MRWRGCPIHAGQAIGRPVPTAVYEQGIAAIRDYEARRAERDAAEARSEQAMRVDATVAKATRVGVVQGTTIVVYRLPSGRLTTRHDLAQAIADGPTI